MINQYHAKDEQRVFIYAKDIVYLTGKSLKVAYLILKKIRAHFNKEAHHAVTFDEFFEYYGIK